MKILFLITDWTTGGAELQVMRMCIELKKMGQEVICVSMMPSEASEMIEKLENNGVHFYSLDMQRGKPRLKDAIHFIKLVNKEKPDVIHAHMVHANYLSRFVRPFICCKTIINTVHGEEEFTVNRNRLYRLTDKRATYTTCCGKVLFDIATKDKIVSKKRLKLVYNGLNLNVYKKNDELRKQYREQFDLGNSFTWVTVGRLAQVKNQKYMIREFAKLCSNYQNTKLVLIGDGNERKNLENIIKEENLQEHVILLGARDDVEKVLNIADAFVLSSVHEGLPLSLQEAGSIGLPMVATDVGGCREVIKDGENGYICESNKTNALKDAMVKVMELDTESRKKMGIKSQQIVHNKFDIVRVMEQWMKLYKSN